MHHQHLLQRAAVQLHSLTYNRHEGALCIARSDGSKTFLSNIEHTWTSFFEHWKDKKMFIIEM